jgi:membrane protein YqaA with SNARE-associated domain
MIESIQNLILGLFVGPGGYVGLFFYSALTTTILPGAPEAAAIFVWKIGKSAVTTIAILTLGNYFGTVINYYIGYTGHDWLLVKYFRIKKERIKRAHRLFERYGPPILLLSWIPIIGDPLTFVPGFVRYNFFKFSFYTITGKLIRYIGLYYLVSRWV